MKIKTSTLIKIMICMGAFVLPIQTALLFALHLPRILQFIYLYITLGYALLLFIPPKIIIKSIDKKFLTFFILLLIFQLISAIINYHEIQAYGLSFIHYIRFYSKTWDDPFMRTFNFTLLRPLIFLSFICMLFVFLRIKNGIKLHIKTITILGISSSIYSIYQLFAAQFGLPFGSLFSGHHGYEIYLVGNLRRVEGLFFEPGPQATFLVIIFSILIAQLFEKNPQIRLFSKTKTIFFTILVGIIAIFTFSPIAFLGIPLILLLTFVMNFGTMKKIIIRHFYKIFAIIFIIFVTFLGLTLYVEKTTELDFSMIKYMQRKVITSLTDFNNPHVYRNPDSRSVRNYVGIKMFKDHKFFGVGPGSTIVHFSKYAPFTSDSLILIDTHAVTNTYINTLAEIGIFAFIVFMLMILYPIFLFIKKYKIIQKSPYKSYINGLTTAYFMHILLSFPANLQFLMALTWIIYVPIVVMLNNPEVYLNNSKYILQKQGIENENTDN